MCAASRDAATPKELLTARTGGEAWRVPLSLHNATAKCGGHADCSRCIVEQPSRFDLLTPKYADFVRRFLSTEKKRPKFLAVAPHQPHNPHAPGLAFQGTSALGVYGDVFAEVDALVAAVLDGTEGRDALFAYTSDNGPRIDDALAGLGGDVGPFTRGGKWGPYEGGHRVPLLLHRPGVVSPGATVALASLMDLFPTFLRAAGVRATRRPSDGVDLAPLFDDGPLRSREDAVRAGLLINSGFAARLGRFKVFLRTQKKTQVHDVFDVSLGGDASESNPIRNASLVRRLVARTRALAREAARSVDRDAVSPPGRVPDSACFCTACADRRRWNCALGSNAKRWPRSRRDVRNWLATCGGATMVYDRGRAAPVFPEGGAEVRWYYERLVPGRWTARLYALLGWRTK